MLAQSDQRGGGQECQEAAHEGSTVAPRHAGQVTNCVDRRKDEQDRCHREDDQAQRVDCQPAVEHRGCWRDPERPDQRRVDRGRRDQEAGAPGRKASCRECGNAGREKRHRNEREEAHQSASSVSRVESRESNSRLMWNTTIPMMKTPTKTSRSTPSSRRNGTRSVCVRPNK